MDDQTERLRSLNTVGTISYVLHLIVAVSAVVRTSPWRRVCLSMVSWCR